MQGFRYMVEKVVTKLVAVDWIEGVVWLDGKHGDDNRSACIRIRGTNKWNLDFKVVFALEVESLDKETGHYTYKIGSEGLCGEELVGGNSEEMYIMAAYNYIMDVLGEWVQKD